MSIPVDSKLWMEEGAWYKVGGLQIVQKDEAPFFIWRRLSREGGSIRFAEISFIMAVGFPAFGYFQLAGDSTSQPGFLNTSFEKHLVGFFLYFIKIVDSSRSGCDPKII
jgi:hypothetical protein